MISIYYYQNKLNNKIYVGQTIDWARRQRQHLKENRLVVEKAIKKYGIENFNLDILEICETYDDANDAEAFWIQILQSIAPNGYNLALGGKNAPRTEEYKRKMSESLMGHPVSQNSIDKLIERNKGKPRSQETKNKIGASLKGKKRTLETKEKMSEKAKGRKSKNKGQTWKVIDGKRIWSDKI